MNTAEEGINYDPSNDFQLLTTARTNYGKIYVATDFVSLSNTANFLNGLEDEVARWWFRIYVNLPARYSGGPN